MIDDAQLLAPKPGVDYKALTAQPSPQDFLVFSRVKGAVSVAQLCTTSGLGREKTLAAIEVLLDVGLLHVVDANGNPVRSAVREPAKPVPAPSAASEVAAPNDRTYVLGAEEMAFAAVPDVSASRYSYGDDDDGDDDEELELEPLALASEPFEMAPESEVIAIEPLQYDEEPFEIDHQPAAAAAAEARPAPVVSSFDTLAPDDEDDDLFMPDSPAHIDRLTGKAPVKRDHGKNAAPAAKPAAARAAVAPPREAKKVNAASYDLFPVDFHRYSSSHARVPGVEEEVQHEVDFVFDHLEYVDFYQLFGVEHTADRKTIRSSYFEMSKRFHPDKFFRDDVGEMASRVDAIFRFVTKGYQTLSKNKNRAEYDEALEHARAMLAQASAEDDRKRGQAADMLERRAEQLEQQGQFAQAAAEFKKIASLRRDPHGFVKAASLLLRANQQLDEAASLARAAVRQLPLEVEPRLVLGQIYEKNQMLVEAAAAFGEAEQIAPGDPSIRVHLERVRSQK